jgi:hypothetical protein
MKKTLRAGGLLPLLVSLLVGCGKDRTTSLGDESRPGASSRKAPRPDPSQKDPPGGPEEKGEAQGEVYTSKFGGYRLRLTPGAARPSEEKPKETSYPIGKATRALMKTSLPDKTVFSVVAVRFPEAMLRLPVDKRLDAVRKGLARQFKDRKPVETPIKLDDYPGRELQIEAPDNKQFRARVYLVKEWMYQISMLGPKNTVTSPEAEKALDSFQLTGR